MNHEDFLVCPICLEVVTDAVESSCCTVLFCEKCVSSINSCPTCRALSFSVKPNLFARKMANSVSIQCDYCNSTITKGDLEDHKLLCSESVKCCTYNCCTFRGKTGEFLLHLQNNHQKDLISVFTRETTLTKDSPPRDPIASRLNSKQRTARLGVKGKYYCKGRTNCKNCCDGRCGPTDGCNCGACMELDIESRKLPKNYWVNRSGATCRRSSETNKVYCGRKTDLPHSDGYCGPTNGPQCRSCRIIESQLAKGFY